MGMPYAWRVLALVSVAFLAWSLPPYLTGGTRVPSTFEWHYPLLVVHVALAGVAMPAAVLQIWPGLRLKRPAVHRRVGRLYCCAAIPAALCALVIGVATPFGTVLAASNAILASLWLWFTVNGYLSARRRNFDEHRRAMIYSATLALSVITNRVWSPVLFVVLMPLQHNVFSGDEEGYLHLVAGLGGWLGWTIPLAVVHWRLGRRRARSSAVPGPTGMPAV